MPANTEGQPAFCNNCPARGDYPQFSWWRTLRPQDFRVNGVPDDQLPEGQDIVVADYARSGRDKGHTWHYSTDVGDMVPAEVGQRLRALSPNEVAAIGSILCGRILLCAGPLLDSGGIPHCPAANHETFMEAVAQVEQHGNLQG